MAQMVAGLRRSVSPTAPAGSSSPAAPGPGRTTIRVEPLETLSDVEQAKKAANLPNLRPESVTTPAAIKDRAIEAASGNPRLLDWLDKDRRDPTLDVDDLIAAIQNENEQVQGSILTEAAGHLQASRLQQC